MNSQFFDLRSENGKKRLNELISFLLNCSMDPDSDYEYEIRIGWGGLSGHVVVNWEETPVDKGDEWYGSFKWVEPGEEIYTEVRFPDEHYEMVPKGTENEALSDWLKEHPEWEKNHMGMWTNVEQNRQFAIDLDVSDWAKRQEMEGDSTFKEYRFSGQILCSKDALSSVGDDVLRRTGYIVAGDDFLESGGCPTSCFSAESEKKKYGECIPAGNVELEYKRSYWGEEPTIEKASVPVYICDECDGMVLYLTDSNYLIARLIPQRNQGDSEAKAKEGA